MAFEKTVLAVAEDCGIEGAYFAYGTMFAPSENVSPESLCNFLKVFEKVQVTPSADEVAFDFV